MDIHDDHVKMCQHIEPMIHAIADTFFAEALLHEKLCIADLIRRAILLGFVNGAVTVLNGEAHDDEFSSTFRLLLKPIQLELRKKFQDFKKKATKEQDSSGGHGDDGP